MNKLISYIFYLFLLLACVAVVLMVLLILGQNDPQPEQMTSSTSEFSSNDLFESLEKDAIPAIFTPTFIPVSSADLEDGDLVLAIEMNGETRAYPINILNWHEVVNDNIGKTPIVITYCPLCRSGLAFIRRHDGRILTFGVSGKLYNDNLVLYDGETDSLWPQFSGKAIAGPLKGAKLSRIPATMTNWGSWKKQHPETLLLSKDTGYERDYSIDPYMAYASGDAQGVSDREYAFNKINGKDLVIGVFVDDSIKAYPIADFKETRIINDFVGSRPVLVYFDQETFTIKVFHRLIDKEPLIFKMATGSTSVDPSSSETNSGPDGNNIIVDEKTGSQWSILELEALNGELEGKRLQEFPATIAYWFAWQASNPETDLYGFEE